MRATKFYNSRVKHEHFLPRDYVMRKLEVSQSQSVGKQSPKWKEPYRIKKKVAPSTYTLETLDGKTIPRSWNISNLRKFYR
ncbi:hypothetical protein Sjap_005797 [Stephania japonica]|uniref:Uncharacterized protein n=1 Tax=Stephania japonica TaxID=461633 RepID=A0AAP0K6D6_9MAGN